MTNVFQSRNFRLVFFGALVSEIGALLYSFAVGVIGNAVRGVFTPASGALFLLFNKETKKF
ncbi:MAG: hypothetical protein IKI51_00965 [Clostridia bacterium]|nr:hypothetical protein [Clostridia bacterium]